MKYENDTVELPDEANDELLKIASSFSVPKSQLEDGEQLIHYTSPQALKSIIDNREFRITRSDFFLDKSENKHAFTVLSEAIKKAKIEDDFKSQLEEFCDSFFHPDNIISETRELANREPKYYVASFSTKEDDLFMWNSYTKTADHSGYAIKFRNTFFDKGYDAGFEFRLFGKVVYDNKEQVQIFVDMLNEFNDWYRKYRSFGYDAMSELMNSFANAFYFQSIFMKKACFSAENEYRMVFEPASLAMLSKSPYPLQEDEEDPYPNYPYKIKHYDRNGVVVPYFRIDINLHEIESVMPSPYMDYEAAEKGLKSLFQIKTMKATIKKSEIPF